MSNFPSLLDDCYQYSIMLCIFCVTKKKKKKKKKTRDEERNIFNLFMFPATDLNSFPLDTIFLK